MRRYLTTGGFLWVDDDFGIDVSFRREMKRVLPEATHPRAAVFPSDFSSASTISRRLAEDP